MQRRVVENEHGNRLIYYEFADEEQEDAGEATDEDG